MATFESNKSTVIIPRPYEDYDFGFELEPKHLMLYCAYNDGDFNSGLSEKQIDYYTKRIDELKIKIKK